MEISENIYPVLFFGESSWVVSSGAVQAGGYPVQVACHLKKLGANPAIITRVGLDDQGKKLIGFIEDMQLPTDFFQVDYEAGTGDADPGYPTRKINPSGNLLQAWDNITWEPSFESLAAQARFFVHGSLGARGDTSRKTLYKFMETGVQRFFDMNLRTPYYTRKLIEDCLTGAFILKLNADELELITGWFARYSSTLERMQVLQDRFRIPYIILSRGMNGCLINASGSVYEHPGFGDAEGEGGAAEEAFTAGCLYKFLQDEEQPENIIGYASAMRSLAASGGGFAYDPGQIHKIMYK
jgi:fructokinase